jgi:hypothetical protein
MLNLLFRSEGPVPGDDLCLAVATARDPTGKVGWSACRFRYALSLTVFDPQGLAA